MNKQLPETMPKIVKESITFHPNIIALRFKENNTWQEMTYKELDEKATALSIALIKKLGVKKGEHISLISENRPEWMISDIAIHYSGAVDVPRGSDTPDEILEYIIQHSDSKIAIVENEKVFKKISPVKNDLRAVILINGREKLPLEENSENIYTLKELIDFGEKNKELKYLVQNRISSIKGSDIASILYTSGTTGKPKGVMLTHKNEVHNIIYLPEGFNFTTKDRLLSFLPIWHAYERQVEYTALRIGASINYGNILTLKSDFKSVKPTVAVFVPDMLTIIYKIVLKNIESENVIKRNLAKFLLNKSIKNAKARMLKNDTYTSLLKENSPRKNQHSKKPIPEQLTHLTLIGKLADKMIFSKVREIFGGELKTAISGAGPLPEKIDEFFYAAGMPIYEGYGLTEAIVVVAVRSISNFKIGTVGRPLPEIKTKIVDKQGKEVGPGTKGTLLISGPNVMKGYYKDKKSTEAVLKDGWLNTGDIAKKTVDGYIKIMGREDDILILTNGEKISPSKIENEIIGNPVIDRAIVVGDGKPYLSAIVYPNKDALENMANKFSITYHSPDELIKNPKIVSEFYKIVYNITSNPKKFAPYEKIEAVKLTMENLAIGKELSETRKLKRKNFYKAHKEEIDSLYK